MKEEQENETLDFSKPDFSFIPGGSHQWRQQGPYILCKSCELEHAVFVGIEQMMTGISEDGMPILKSRV
jgi:hypothetical protein